LLGHKLTSELGVTTVVGETTIGTFGTAVTVTAGLGTVTVSGETPILILGFQYREVIEFTVNMQQLYSKQVKIDQLVPFTQEL